MLNLVIPRRLLYLINHCRGGLSRESYILKCVDYITTNNININHNNNDNNERDYDRIKITNERGKDIN